MFEENRMDTHDHLNLHNKPLPSISWDVHSFVVNQLQQIAWDWTDSSLFTFTEIDIEVIVKKAGPLFIFASTVCRSIVVEDSTYDTLQDMLRQVSTTMAGSNGSAQEGLNSLYIQIFEDAFRECRDGCNQKVRADLHDVVSFILLLSQPLGLC